jgi:hypothetical protein
MCGIRFGVFLTECNPKEKKLPQGADMEGFNEPCAFSYITLIAGKALSSLYLILWAYI